MVGKIQRSSKSCPYVIKEIDVLQFNCCRSVFTHRKSPIHYLCHFDTNIAVLIRIKACHLWQDNISRLSKLLWSRTTCPVFSLTPSDWAAAAALFFNQMSCSPQPRFLGLLNPHLPQCPRINVVYNRSLEVQNETHIVATVWPARRHMFLHTNEI